MIKYVLFDQYMILYEFGLVSIYVWIGWILYVSKLAGFYVLICVCEREREREREERHSVWYYALCVGGLYMCQNSLEYVHRSVLCVSENVKTN